MEYEQFSGDEEAEHGWTSDEQEIVNLVEAFIDLDAVPADVTDEVERLHNSKHPHKALKIILESLD